MEIITGFQSKYSGDPNTGLVGFSNGKIVSVWQMLRIQTAVWNGIHLSGFQMASDTVTDGEQCAKGSRHYLDTLISPIKGSS